MRQRLPVRPPRAPAARRDRVIDHIARYRGGQRPQRDLIRAAALGSHPSISRPSHGHAGRRPERQATTRRQHDQLTASGMPPEGHEAACRVLGRPRAHSRCYQPEVGWEEIVRDCADRGLQILPGRLFFWDDVSQNDGQEFARIALMRDTDQIVTACEILRPALLDRKSGVAVVKAAQNC
jgi:hypothetical protein